LHMCLGVVPRGEAMGLRTKTIASMVCLLAFLFVSGTVLLNGREGGTNDPVDSPPIVIGVSNVQSGGAEFLGQSLIGATEKLIQTG
jgi:hypothetical protein